MAARDAKERVQLPKLPQCPRIQGRFFLRAISSACDLDFDHARPLPRHKRYGCSHVPTVIQGGYHPKTKERQRWKTMTIWGAFGFVALGMALAHLYNWLAWRKYYEGKRENGGERLTRR